MSYLYNGVNSLIPPGTPLNSSIGWGNMVGTQATNAIQINGTNNQTMVRIDFDGSIETQWGNTSIREAMEISMAMKALLLEMARDEETCKKFPVVEEFAHKLLMTELKK